MPIVFCGQRWWILSALKCWIAISYDQAMVSPHSDVISHNVHCEFFPYQNTLIVTQPDQFGRSSTVEAVAARFLPHLSYLRRCNCLVLQLATSIHTVRPQNIPNTSSYSLQLQSSDCFIATSTITCRNVQVSNAQKWLSEKHKAKMACEKPFLKGDHWSVLAHCGWSCHEHSTSLETVRWGRP